MSNVHNKYDISIIKETDLLNQMIIMYIIPNNDLELYRSLLEELKFSCLLIKIRRLENNKVEFDWESSPYREPIIIDWFDIPEAYVVGVDEDVYKKYYDHLKEIKISKRKCYIVKSYDDTIQYQSIAKQFQQGRNFDFYMADRVEKYNKH